MIAIALAAAAISAMIDNIAPDFTLTDQSGHAFSPSGQRGHVTILFFGYTHCPDICPTSLAAIASALRQIGPSSDRDIKVAFITDDPARDTPKTLRDFVTLFDPYFFGLSGSGATLAPIYKNYHVWFTRLPNQGSAAGYLLAHSSYIYMIDKTGVVRTIDDWHTPPTTIAAHLRKLCQ
jgi:protein SCO1/2